MKLTEKIKLFFKDRFIPSFWFWINVFCSLLNLGSFILTGSKFSFFLSIICTILALITYKIDRLMWDMEKDKKDNKNV